MLNKTSKDTEVQQGAYIEGTIDKEIIPGETFLELDDNTIKVEEVEEEKVIENGSGNLIVEQLIYESDFIRLARVFKESGKSVDNILNNEDISSELYASALYNKLRICNIPDDVIRNELDNIIIYGSNATCMSEEQWNRLFGNLGNTISIYDNVVDYYYPLAKYVHLYNCDLEHSSLFFDEFRITDVVNRLDVLGEKFGVNFILSVSCDESELDESLKSKVIVSL